MSYSGLSADYCKDLQAHRFLQQAHSFWDEVEFKTEL